MTNITAKQFNLLAWFTIVVTVFLVFGQSLGHQFLVNWDDPFYVSQNPYIRGFSLINLQAAFSKFYAGHYAPVQMLSYLLDYSIWGGKPFGFILGNLIYHAVTSILVYHLLLRCGCSRLPSLLGALLFVVHPTQVESVAWISSRKNLLSMLFMLVAFHAYLSYRAMPRGERGPWYALLVGSFVLALLAKSVAVVLVPLLVLYDWAFPNDQPQPRWLDKLPLLLTAALVAGLAVFSQGPEFNGGRAPWHGGSPWATFLTMLPVTAAYLRLLVWPTGLSAFYDPPVRLVPDAAVVGSALLLLALAIGAMILARRNRPACFWALTFFIGFAPVLQIVPLVSLMNDRYFYTPLLGISGLVAAGLTAADRAKGPRPYWLGGMTLVVALLAITTWCRVPYWRDASTLWLDAIPKAGTSGTLWSNLIEAHFEEGKLANIPPALRADTGFARGVERLMVTYITRNKALKANLFAQRLIAAYPDWATGYLALSETSLLLGNRELAETAFNKAREVTATPDASILVAMGVALLRLQQLELANDALAKAQALNDTSAELFYGLACLKAAGGQADEAVALLRLALAKKPALGPLLPQEQLLEPLRQLPAFQQLPREAATPK